MAASFNVYITGVGGQGIGLLAEALARAAGHAGLSVRGCDTHGLAQRGGIVSSFVRIGDGAHSPIVPVGSAQLVLALERTESLRACREWLAPRGALVWYDAVWQPLPVRLGEEGPVVVADVEAVCTALGARSFRVAREDLPDPRMQNVAVLGAAAARALLPGVGLAHLRAALEDLMEGPALEKNIAALEAAADEAAALG